MALAYRAGRTDAICRVQVRPRRRHRVQRRDERRAGHLRSYPGSSVDCPRPDRGRARRGTVSVAGGERRFDRGNFRERFRRALPLGEPLGRLAHEEDAARAAWADRYRGLQRRHRTQDHGRRSPGDGDRPNADGRRPSHRRWRGADPTHGQGSLLRRRGACGGGDRRDPRCHRRNACKDGAQGGAGRDRAPRRRTHGRSCPGQPIAETRGCRARADRGRAAAERGALSAPLQRNSGHAAILRSRLWVGERQPQLPSGTKTGNRSGSCR